MMGYEVDRRIRTLRVEGERVLDDEEPGGGCLCDELPTLAEAVDYADMMAVADGGAKVLDHVREVGAVRRAVFCVTDAEGKTVYERDALDAMPAVRRAFGEAVRLHYARLDGAAVERRTVGSLLKELARREYERNLLK